MPSVCAMPAVRSVRRFAIAVLYALAMVLLMLLVDPMIGPDVSAVGTEVPRRSFADLWVFLLLFSTFTGQATLGLLRCPGARHASR